MNFVRRRAVLLGGVSLAAAAAVSAFLIRQNLEDQQRLHAAQTDYLAGRVSIVDGWIMANSEANRRQSISEPGGG